MNVFLSVIVEPRLATDTTKIEERKVETPSNAVVFMPLPHKTSLDFAQGPGMSDCPSQYATQRGRGAKEGGKAEAKSRRGGYRRSSISVGDILARPSPFHYHLHPRLRRRLHHQHPQLLQLCPCPLIGPHRANHLGRLTRSTRSTRPTRPAVIPPP